MKCLTILMFFALTLISCKKDKLEGEKSVLIGKWNWIYTSHNYGWCDGDNYNEIITPNSEGNNFSMEFMEKGIVEYHENNLLIDKDRLAFDDFITSSEIFSFRIFLDNKRADNSKILTGEVSEDTMLIIRGFPFENAVEGCEVYGSYFVRE